MSYVLILYYSRNGSCRRLAQEIAKGVEQAGLECRLRTVAPVSPDSEASLPSIPEQGDIYCSKSDLSECSALILGSPTRFGNMAAPLKYFIDSTSEHWLNGNLIGKPAGVFTSSTSMHGGQETTLISMMMPLIHHGMLIAGVPYSESALHETQSGGTPYGPSHVEIGKDLNTNQGLSLSEIDICIAFGKRIAKLAMKLAS